MTKQIPPTSFSTDEAPWGVPPQLRIEDHGDKSVDNGVIAPLNATEINELWNDVSTRRLDSRAKADSNEKENFPATSIKALYTSVRNNEDSTPADIGNLDSYLPNKIVDETRDEVLDRIRLGQSDGVGKALQDALERLQQEFNDEPHTNPTPWKIGIAEILIDQGRRKEAREVLSHCPNYERSTQSSPTRRRHGRRADSKFREMQNLAEDVEHDLDIYRRAEDWKKARELGATLYKIDPSYFDLDAREPMERFSKVRRILHLGLLKEIDADNADGLRERNCALREALEIYNHGCIATELYHEFFDGNEAKVYGFDHSDCANLFFSAARICYNFDRYGLADKHGHRVPPRDFRCKGPPLTAQTWKEQALHYLEQGRARALFDTIIRGSGIGNISRRLIAETVIKDMSELAAMAVKTLKNRASLSSPNGRSRTASMSTSRTTLHQDQKKPGTQALQSVEPSLTGTTDASLPVQACVRDIERRRLLPLQTTGLDGSAASSLSDSPANTLTPVPSDEEIYAEMKVHMRWRKALLYALAKGNPSLSATLGAALPSDGKPALIEELRSCIPDDALVVEYALVSTPPCGIMTVIVASDEVKALYWKQANTVDIQNHIRDLRASMASPDSWTRGFQPRLSRAGITRGVSRPSGPERRSSTVQQQQLDDVLRDLVITPVMAHLSGKKRLIIVPSGELTHVPWSIFFDLPITVVPSLGIWKCLQDQLLPSVTRNPKTSIVSNAPIDKERARNLLPAIRDIPFSQIEALYIARLHNQFPFLADDQDRKDFEKYAKKTNLLHICAHSTFDPERPLSSSLQLFKDPLTINDWHKLAIEADLVVFSSCLSGVSKAYDSGSTIGFAHTLLSTGTKAFVGSLWPVDDAATLLLMMMFYEELRKPLPVADALFNAQKRMQRLTHKELHDIIDVLEEVAMKGEIEDYVFDPESCMEELRELVPSELAEARFWAAFVLTGYGSRAIYPNAV